MTRNHHIIQFGQNIIVAFISAVGHIYLVNYMVGSGMVLIAILAIEAAICITVLYSKILRDVKLLAFSFIVGAFLGVTVGLIGWMNTMNGFMDSY